MEEIKEYYHENVNQLHFHYFINSKGRKYGIYKSYFSSGNMKFEGVMINGRWYNVYKQYSLEYNKIENIDTCKENLDSGIVVEFEY